MSLKARLALVIALLAFLPNLTLSLLLGGGGWGLLLWLLLVALASGGLGYLLAQALLAPLEELTRAVGYLSWKGSLHELHLPPPKAPPPKEIALLRARFGELLGRIRELLEAREALYGALAHDLKTPLLGAIRALEYLERAGEIGREGRIGLLKTLRRELEGSHRLLENLLLLARLEGRRPAMETLNLRALAEDLALRYREEAQRRGLALEVRGKGYARGERTLVERALANLLENALRYAKTQVAIGVEEGALWVEDDGPGLPLPLEALARPFRQGPGAKGASGLGLYAARLVAEAHGGKLLGERSPLGGARLGLLLPKGHAL